MANCLRHFSVQDSVPSSIFFLELLLDALPLAEVLRTEGQAAFFGRALPDRCRVTYVIVGVRVLGVARGHIGWFGRGCTGVASGLRLLAAEEGLEMSQSLLEVGDLGLPATAAGLPV